MFVGIKQFTYHQLTTNRVAKYAVLAVLVCSLALAIAYEGMPVTDRYAATTHVVVHEGDTLWDLARDYGPAHADPRQTVSRIREANHLTGSLIRPGEVVYIPQS
jgi:nucleoid-associated protein YgaU